VLDVLYVELGIYDGDYSNPPILKDALFRNFKQNNTTKHKEMATHII